MVKKILTAVGILLCFMCLITCRSSKNDNRMKEQEFKTEDIKSEETSTQDQKFQDQKTKDQKLQDQNTQDQKFQDQKTKDQKSQDQNIQDQKANDTKTQEAKDEESEDKQEDMLSSIYTPVAPGTPETSIITSKEASMATSGQRNSKDFYYEELSKEIKARITGKSYVEDCEVPFEELRYVKVLYWGFDEEPHVGELIVNKAIAEDITEIFKDLYEIKYPIEQMVLVDEYDADDEASMAANNTSAFNYRMIAGTNRLSKHSYGYAIDINPLYNPYVRVIEGKTVITPEKGEQYADRSLNCEYYIKEDDPCYQAFITRGFTWGGEWKNQKDYQHFQKLSE